MTINKLKLLLEQKEKNIRTKEDKERVENLKFLLKQENIFFHLETKTAVGILDFLGIPQDKIYDCYLDLISAEKFHEINFKK